MFKKDVTITISLVITAIFLCFIPSIFVLYMLFFVSDFNKIIFDLLLVFLLIFIINIILLLISLIISIFIKTKHYINEIVLIIASKNNIEIRYEDRHIFIELLELKMLFFLNKKCRLIGIFC